MTRASFLVLLTITLVCITRAAVNNTDCPASTVFSNSALDANFKISDGEQQVTCTTSADNVVFDTGSTPPAVNLGIGVPATPAPGDLPYTCAQYRTAVQTKFGQYTCRMKAQNFAGVVSSCFWSSATSGPSYQEIYFRFYGTNNTRVHIGYYTSTGTWDKEIPVTLQTDADFQTYTIEYQNNFVRWYINGLQQGSAAAGVGANGNIPIPNLTGFFRVSYYTSANNAAENAKYGVYAGGATPNIEVSDMRYTPSCSNTDSLSSDAESNDNSQDPKIPSWQRTCSKKAPFVIYDDSLAAGVTDSSGSTIHNLANTQFNMGGTAISWNVEDTSKIAFTFAKPIPLVDSYWAIEMWLYSDSTNKQIKIGIYSGATLVGSELSLSDYLGPQSSLTPGQWFRIQIPIADFRASSGIVDSFNVIQLTPTYADYFGVLYMDRIHLTYGPPCLGKSQIVYDDALAAGWTDNSWGTYDLAVTANAESGTAMYLRLYNGGLRLHSVNGFSTNDWFAISFDINLIREPTLVGNPSINIGVTSNGGQDYRSYPLANYFSGQFPGNDGQYVTISIPLSDFGIYENQVLDGFWIQDNTQANEGKLYVDNVRLQQKAADSTSSNDSSFGFPVAKCSAALVAMTAAALML